MRLRISSKTSVILTIIGLLVILILIGAYLYKQGFFGSAGLLIRSPLQKNNLQELIPSLPASPSAKDYEEYADKLQSLARESKTLTFTECKGNPAVLKFKKGQELAVRNNDNQQITVNIDSKNSFPLEGEQTKTIKPDLKVALYTVACHHAVSGVNSNAAKIQVIE